MNDASEQRYNFAIIPPKGISEKAIGMSKEIANHGSLFVLDGIGLFPHVSLYHVGFDPQNLPEIIQRTAEALKTARPFRLISDSYRAVEGVWIDVSYEKSDDIMRLHTAIIDATKDLRFGKGKENDCENFRDLSEERKNNLLACGWSEAFGLFSPHLTFSKLREKHGEILQILPQEDFSFLVDRIGLFELGDYGTCTKLIHEFRLG